MLSTTTTLITNDHYSINYLLIILFSIVYRVIISFYPYSGQSKPIMFGDYEAQRHWMDITYNLNANDWYKNTTDNDLLYWGLDYPPLTAYHSYLMGYIANKINPKFVELHKSRGYESNDHKLFMRISVLISDLIVFYVSVMLILNKITKPSSSKLFNLLLLLLNPCILLIDYGHFQYNCVSLGFMQISLFCLFNDYHLIGSIFYCFALNYKQMELYHSLPIFVYLLSTCIKQGTFRKFFIKLTSLAFIVLLTFALCWLPYINDLNKIIQVLTRLFPFSRGLFEDKVANFWCFLSIFIKLKEMYEINVLSLISLITTFLSLLPSLIHLFIKQTKQHLLLSLINCSLVFFLFSFQVHEKSILLATIPACLLITHYPLLITWFLLISSFSMFPLLCKDGLMIPYLCTNFLYFLIIYHSYNEKLWNLFEINNKKYDYLFNYFMCKYCFFISISISVILSVCHALFDTPIKRYPDFWTVLICIYSFLHFFLFLFIFHLLQFTLIAGNNNNNKTTTKKTSVSSSSSSKSINKKQQDDEQLQQDQHETKSHLEFNCSLLKSFKID